MRRAEVDVQEIRRDAHAQPPILRDARGTGVQHRTTRASRARHATGARWRARSRVTRGATPRRASHVPVGNSRATHAAVSANATAQVAREHSPRGDASGQATHATAAPPQARSNLRATALA